MNKPDGITQDAWDKAREVGLNAYLNEFYVTEIARSIQSAVEAERYRCARVAMNPGFIHAQDSEFDMGVNFAKSLIANAILDSK